MAKRRPNLEKMATQAREWLACCDYRIRAAEDELARAKDEHARATAMLESLEGKPTAVPTDALPPASLSDRSEESDRLRQEAAPPNPCDKQSDGLSPVTIMKLKSLGLTTPDAIREATNGDLSKLQSMGDVEDRLGPREVSAIRKWMEAK
ncbi:MAG: hypothetical protein KGL39_53090 [Patescibacteria group bacterium]|nr:hypothetical protein [Patescibacteria group bacterium]